MDYIIVQAGGKGSRMGSLTLNKPKALVPIDNKPILFHLFDKFKDKKFIIIGDYKYEVLEKYLKAFATVDYTLVDARGYSGTCSGISKALEIIPSNSRFMLIWCDLVLSDEHVVPEKGNIIGISKGFKCRWSYIDDSLIEKPSEEYGVAGYFVFDNKKYIEDVPLDGEFVKWLQTKNIKFNTCNLYNTYEYGTYDSCENKITSKHRSFNSIVIDENGLYKIPINDKGIELAEKEINWYKAVSNIKGLSIPKIYSYSPLHMSLINGKCIYEYDNLNYEEKLKILTDIVNSLKLLHNHSSIKSEEYSYIDTYINKTFNRLDKVYDLVPFAKNEYIKINGKICRNIFYNKDLVSELVMKYFPSEFKFIHGDCTFSNIMLENNKPVLIDPRGYFGDKLLYGDAAYDWAKLYYSLYSDYDQFNLKRFSLNIDYDTNSVLYSVESNGWKDLEKDFFELVGSEINKKQMRLFLALIWLSLTTYIWENYDSICAAFYIGTYYLEEVLESDA